MDRAIKIFLAVFGGVLTLALMLSIYYVLIPSFSENLEPVKFVDVEIRLDNQCSVTDAPLLLSTTQPNGQIPQGCSGDAFTENAKVKLAVSPEFLILHMMAYLNLCHQIWYWWQIVVCPRLKSSRCDERPIWR